MQALEAGVARSFPASSALPTPLETVIIGRVPAKRARLGAAISLLALASGPTVFLNGCEPAKLRLLPSLGAEAGVETGSRSAVSADASPVCDRDFQCERPQRCNPESGRCVDCLSSDDCDLPEDCDPVALHCALPCDRGTDCRASEADLCNTPRGFCVECIDDSDCTSRSARYCDRTSGQCVTCANASDCSSTRP